MREISREINKISLGINVASSNKHVEVDLKLNRTSYDYFNIGLCINWVIIKPHLKSQISIQIIGQTNTCGGGDQQTGVYTPSKPTHHMATETNTECVNVQTVWDTWNLPRGRVDQARRCLSGLEQSDSWVM